MHCYVIYLPLYCVILVSRDCRETCQKLTDWILTSDAEYLRWVTLKPEKIHKISLIKFQDNWLLWFWNTSVTFSGLLLWMGLKRWRKSVLQFLLKFAHQNMSSVSLQIQICHWWVELNNRIKLLLIKCIGRMYIHLPIFRSLHQSPLFQWGVLDHLHHNASKGGLIISISRLEVRHFSHCSIVCF